MGTNSTIQRLKLKVGKKSCISCGYFSSVQSKDDQGDVPHGEVTNSSRAYYGRLDTPPSKANDDIHCFRNVWIVTTGDPEFPRPDDRSEAIWKQIKRPRWCGSYYPYSEGTPESHRDSHRSRTNRRWIVAGGLLGPYVATMVGFSAAQLSSETGNSLGIEFVLFAIAGFVGLGLFAIAINLLFNQRG